MFECTFKPKINEGKMNVSYILGEGEAGLMQSVSIRNQIWEQNRQNKLQEIRKINQDSELVNCTFKPNLNPVSQGQAEPSLPNREAVQKFIER